MPPADQRDPEEEAQVAYRRTVEYRDPAQLAKRAKETGALVARRPRCR